MKKRLDFPSVYALVAIVINVVGLHVLSGGYGITEKIAFTGYVYLWPYNLFYIHRLNDLGIPAAKIAFITVSSSTDVLILVISATYSMINLFNKEWLTASVLPAKIWGKGCLCLVAILLFLCWYNFSHDYRLSSLDVDRPLIISASIISRAIITVSMFVFYLAIHLIRAIYQYIRSAM